MNDSFLEDLDLVPKDANAQNNSQINNRYITTRKVLTPPVSNRSKLENLEPKHDKIISSSSTNLAKAKGARRSGSQEPRKLSPSEVKPLSSTPKSQRRSQTDENTKPKENHIKPEEVKAKPNDARVASKVSDKTVTDKRRTSGSLGSSGKCLDSSTKENTRPATDTSSSRESGSQIDLKKSTTRRVSDSSRKSDIFEKTDPVVLLNAIKDLVSRYTEQETVKVLRAMQNLHVNSQANLIKNLMSQTSELVNELSIGKNSGNVKSLIEENEKMREDIFILQARNEVLQKRIDEMSVLREENISLKMKLKELQQ